MLLTSFDAGTRRYAFGTGTQVLPIPELMPFRLTRQMAGVLAPHDALAVLAGPMTAAFAALRSGADVLEVCRSAIRSCRVPGDLSVFPHTIQCSTALKLPLCNMMCCEKSRRSFGIRKWRC